MQGKEKPRLIIWFLESYHTVPNTNHYQTGRVKGRTLERAMSCICYRVINATIIENGYSRQAKDTAIS